jgi:hypothetical protein
MYRGESGLFPSTRTSLARLIDDDSIDAETLNTIVALAEHVRNALQTRFGLPLQLAEGFLQHYGLPTPLLDVSPDFDVAVQFATSLTVGDWGALAVMPMEPLRESDSFMLADLSRHPLADRSRRQSAYAFHDLAYHDHKDPAAIVGRELKWHWFRFTEEDESTFAPDPYLLDASSDSTAGLIGLLLTDRARFDDGAARWLADRVPATSVALRIIGSNESGLVGQLISAEDGGDLYQTDSESNYRRWSSAFSDHGTSAPGRGIAEAGSPAEVPPGIGLGATLWPLQSDLFQAAKRIAPE